MPSMLRIKTGIISKSFLLLFIPLLLLTQIASILVPGAADATSGESFNWIDSKSISATGGQLKSPATFSVNSDGDNTFYAARVTIYRSSDHNAGYCDMSLKIQINNGQVSGFDKGIISVWQQATPHPKNQNYCDTLGSNGNAVINLYKNPQLISIGNTQNATKHPPEDPNNRIVNVRANINADGFDCNQQLQDNTNSSLPKTDAITLVSISNPNDKFNPVTSNIQIQEADRCNNGSGTALQGSLFFTATFRNVSEGDYKTCSLAAANCQTFHKTKDKVAFVYISAKNKTYTYVAPANSKSAEDNSCQARGGDFGWALCPITTIIDTTLGWIDSAIQSLLTLNSGAYTNGSLHQAWGQLRNIAYLILVPIMLVMVIGTALGFSFLDAYTVRRALPRMVIAIIFIALSWSITTFLIKLTNIVGAGVMGLMTYPFKAASGSLSNMTLSNLPIPGNNTIGSSIIQWLIGLPGLLVAIIVIIWLFGGTILLFAGIGFLVLLIRQVLIVFLVLMAPLAILAWIFPGNDKLWKQWWSLFSKLLLMFPLIMGLIASGRIFAYILAQGGINDGSFSSIIRAISILIVWMLPYALIPLTFRFAGGIFATVTGMINDRSKGLFDRQKKGRAEKIQRIPEGTLFKGAGEKGIRHGLNRFAQGAALAPKAGLRPSRWKSNIQSIRDSQNLENALENSEKVLGGRSFFASDDLMLAGLDGGGDYQKTFDVLSAKGWTSDQARIGASQAIQIRRAMGSEQFQLAALAKLPATGTAFEEENIGQWHQLASKYTRGNKSTQASLVAAAKSGFRSAQRYEASEAGFGDWMEGIKMADAGADTQAITDMIVDSAYKSGGAPAVVGSRNAKSARMFVEAAKRDLRDSAKSNDRGRWLRSLASVANIQDQQAGGKRIVTDVLAQELMGFDLGGGVTVLQALNNERGSAEFQQARRELGQEYTPEQRAAIAAQQGQGPITPGTPPTPPIGGGLGGPRVSS